MRGRKAPRAEHRWQLQGAHKSVCQQKPRVHSSRGKADRQQSTDRNGPHTAQPPRKPSRGEALQPLPPSATLPRAASAQGQAGSVLSLAGGQRRWVGSEQLLESSHSPVGNASWRYPKAAGGTLFTRQTQGALPALRYHTNSRANSFAAGSREASQVLALIFSTNTAPEVQAARAPFLRDRRAGLSMGTLGQGHVWPKRIKASLESFVL